MSRNDNKRKLLFDRFSSHLNFLKSNGFLPDLELQFPKTYICPICLEHFPEQALEEKSRNRLTLEDAPPKSLGGSQIALTCKSCNNTCGHEVDFHLSDRLRELDASEFLPYTTQKVTMENEGKTVTGYVKVESNGEIKITHDKRYNNPQVLEDYIASLKDESFGGIVNLIRKKSRVEKRVFGIALLKTAYILTFAKFGYTFILDSVYNKVREQLLNPSLNVYPEEFWTEQSTFLEQHEGVHFSIKKGLESVYPIFPLKTNSKIRRFGVALPFPTKPFEDIVDNIMMIGEGDSMSFDPMDGADYLFNLEAINKAIAWIEKLKNN
ncbi:hypothetical protein [Rufibacter latericius]|uniref:HNH endonuclease 5 domain-containing protein n=1 Tax=Rufibacter latericius TaxID=2487040 RepID=A0A3M9MDD9_9BACT|nr:hypothetical protein [Rufibacter latericius]RNI23566.1 hypothetical protein EFB08_18725 [Rufibacter latericius]